MSVVDLSPILTPLLQVAGIALGMIGAWVLTRLAQKLGVQKNGVAMQNLDDAAMKSIQSAVMATQPVIKQLGWDHPSTQSQMVAMAGNYLAGKFQQTLKQSGIDPATPDGQAKIKDLITRALPVGVAVAAASPTTPDKPATAAPQGDPHA